MTLEASVYLIFIFIGATCLLGALIMSLTYIYVGTKHINTLLGYLSNCDAIKSQRYLLRMGAWGKLVMIGTIAGALARPNYLLKKGQLSASDLESFPPSAKKKLIISYYINMAIIAGIVISAGTTKLIS